MDEKTRALVLGATGHIGAHVVRALLAKGYAVRAAFRAPRYRFVLDGLPVEAFPLDLEDANRLGTALALPHALGWRPFITSPRQLDNRVRLCFVIECETYRIFPPCQAADAGTGRFRSGSH